MSDDGYFGRAQGGRFAVADRARARWIETTSLVRDHEAAIHDAFVVERGPVLEVGAGECGTLRMRPEVAARGYVGTDLHVDRARAVRAAGGAGLACDAAQLPFAARAFGTVLCRDLLHHLDPAARARAVAEMARVVDDDGVVTIIEPNGARAPLVAMFSAAVPTERMALEFTAERLRALVAPCFASVEVEHIEPSALYRLLFHYRFGAPSLARWPAVLRLVRSWERVAASLPPAVWSYVRLVCRRPR